jgi:heat shock protein HtpX
MTITATISGALTMLAQFVLFFGNNLNNPLGIIGTVLVVILAPVAAMLVQMAISRTREYAADKAGAKICGNPLWLAAAPQKLGSTTLVVDNQIAENNPATAHMFIINSLHTKSMDSFFSTHPNMNNRIERLRSISGNQIPRAKSQTLRSRLPNSGGKPSSRKGPWS